MIGLTSLWINRQMTAPELSRRRALLVLDKIDEILHWEQTKDRERDERFVELGQYLCEVRAGQFWRLEDLKSFDEYLQKRFPESRRKAYYLMAIHENLTRIPKRRLREIGWTKATEMAKVARRDGRDYRKIDSEERWNVTSRAKKPSLGKSFTSSCTRVNCPWSNKLSRQRPLCWGAINPVATAWK